MTSSLPRAGFANNIAVIPTDSALQVRLTDDRVLDENLGQPSSPQVDPETGNIFIEYVNGTAPCGDNGVWTTRIDFLCPDDQGHVRCIGTSGRHSLQQDYDEPAFVDRSTEDCTVSFEWVTSLACPAETQAEVDVPVCVAASMMHLIRCSHAWSAASLAQCGT